MLVILIGGLMYFLDSDKTDSLVESPRPSESAFLCVSWWFQHKEGEDWTCVGASLRDVKRIPHLLLLAPVVHTPSGRSFYLSSSDSVLRLWSFPLPIPEAVKPS